MKLSLIVPVFNAAAYLPKFWASLEPQLSVNHDVEMIFVNDGSSDSSWQLLESYCEGASRVRIINQENLGVSVARNRGVESSNGEFLAFLDPDDVPAECYLEEVLKPVLEGVVDIAVFAYQIKTDNTLTEKRIKIKNCDGLNGIEYFDQKLIQQRQIERRPWNKVYRAELITANNIRFNSDLKLGQDMVFNIQMFYAARIIKLFDRVIYIYNKNNPDSSTALARSNVTLGINRRIILSRIMRSTLDEWRDARQVRLNMLGFAYRETVRDNCEIDKAY